MNNKTIINKKILYTRDFDNKQIEGRLVYQLTIDDEELNFSKNIGLIYYKDKTRDSWGNVFENMVFRFVDIEDENLTIFDEESIYKGNNKYELVKNYGKLEYSIINGIYYLVMKYDPMAMCF